jgi:hypothetical protein
MVETIVKSTTKTKSKATDVSKEKMDVAALMELLDRKHSKPPLDKDELKVNEENISEQLRAIEQVEEKLRNKTAYGKKNSSNDMAEDIISDQNYSYNSLEKKPGANKTFAMFLLGIILALAAVSYFVSQRNIEFSDDEIAILKDKKTKEEIEAEKQDLSISLDDLSLAEKAEQKIDEVKPEVAPQLLPKPEVQQKAVEEKPIIKPVPELIAKPEIETPKPEVATNKSLNDKDAAKILDLLRKN